MFSPLNHAYYFFFIPSVGGQNIVPHWGGGGGGDENTRLAEKTGLFLFLYLGERVEVGKGGVASVPSSTRLLAMESSNPSTIDS
jgi:hypothetical protein